MYTKPPALRGSGHRPRTLFRERSGNQNKPGYGEPAGSIRAARTACFRPRIWGGGAEEKWQMGRGRGEGRGGEGVRGREFGMKSCARDSPFMGNSFGSSPSACAAWSSSRGARARPRMRSGTNWPLWEVCAAAALAAETVESVDMWFPPLKTPVRPRECGFAEEYTAGAGEVKGICLVVVMELSSCSKSTCSGVGNLR